MWAFRISPMVSHRKSPSELLFKVTLVCHQTIDKATVNLHKVIGIVTKSLFVVTRLCTTYRFLWLHCTNLITSAKWPFVCPYLTWKHILPSLGEQIVAQPWAHLVTDNTERYIPLTEVTRFQTECHRSYCDLRMWKGRWLSLFCSKLILLRPNWQRSFWGLGHTSTVDGVRGITQKALCSGLNRDRQEGPSAGNGWC